MKTLVQCDFDATLTIGEVSHSILETFAEGDWQQCQKDYYGGRITVEDCNTIQFAMVKKSPETLRNFLLHSGKVVMRPGFNDFFNYGRERGWDFVIISNGLRFYIEVLLESLDVRGIDIIAAECEFRPEGLKLTYPGIYGKPMEKGFKAARAEKSRQGYDTVYYLGDGKADIPPARHADHVFAVDKLLRACIEENIPHTPFKDLYDVIDYFKKNHQEGV